MKYTLSLVVLPAMVCTAQHDTHTQQTSGNHIPHAQPISRTNSAPKFPHSPPPRPPRPIGSSSCTSLPSAQNTTHQQPLNCPPGLHGATGEHDKKKPSSQRGPVAQTRRRGHRRQRSKSANDISTFTPAKKPKDARIPVKRTQRQQWALRRGRSVTVCNVPRHLKMQTAASSSACSYEADANQHKPSSAYNPPAKPHKMQKCNPDLSYVLNQPHLNTRPRPWSFSSRDDVTLKLALLMQQIKHEHRLNKINNTEHYEALKKTQEELAQQAELLVTLSEQFKDETTEPLARTAALLKEQGTKQEERMKRLDHLEGWMTTQKEELGGLKQTLTQMTADVKRLLDIQADNIEHERERHEKRGRSMTAMFSNPLSPRSSKDRIDRSGSTVGSPPK